MLRRAEPVSESELHAANLALAELVDAPDPQQFLAQRKAALPATLHPLLMACLASAWADADCKLSAALEKLHRLVSQNP
jgi:hypothetical protein